MKTWAVKIKSTSRVENHRLIEKLIVSSEPQVSEEKLGVCDCGVSKNHSEVLENEWIVALAGDFIANEGIEWLENSGNGSWGLLSHVEHVHFAVAILRRVLNVYEIPFLRLNLAFSKRDLGQSIENTQSIEEKRHLPKIQKKKHQIP